MLYQFHSNQANTLQLTLQIRQMFYPIPFNIKFLVQVPPISVHGSILQINGLAVNFHGY